MVRKLVFFVEVDSKYPGEIREKTKIFPFCPRNKISPQDNISEYMNQMNTKNYTQSKNLICDWTDNKKYFN